MGSTRGKGVEGEGRKGPGQKRIDKSRTFGRGRGAGRLVTVCLQRDTSVGFPGRSYPESVSLVVSYDSPGPWYGTPPARGQEGRLRAGCGSVPVAPSYEWESGPRGPSGKSGRNGPSGTSFLSRPGTPPTKPSLNPRLARRP